MPTQGGFLVGLYTISDCNLRLEYAQAVHRASYNGTITEWVVIPNGSYLDIGRNKAVWQFYDVNEKRDEEGLPPNDFLLFVDDDTGFTDEDIELVVKAACDYYEEEGVWPVVGGAYLGAGPEGSFVVAYRMNYDNDAPLMDNVKIAEVSSSHDVIEVDGVGTGFMLIHRHILEHIEEFHPRPMVWFHDIVSTLGDFKDPGWFGEDLAFCLRAKKLGHPTLLHCGVRLTHYKTQGLVFPPDDQE